MPSKNRNFCLVIPEQHPILPERSEGTKVKGERNAKQKQKFLLGHSRTASYLARSQRGNDSAKLAEIKMFN
jgi:hypothetical protein